MSVENFDGDGFADQPSIIYSFETDDSGEVQIRELARSGFGEVGPSPGDVVERETTKSDPTDSLSDLPLPGQGGLARDDCGADIPAFACAGDEGCSKPVYVGRTCANPTCKRDWPAAVKRKVVTTAGKLEGFRRMFFARYDGANVFDFKLYSTVDSRVYVRWLTVCCYRVGLSSSSSLNLSGKPYNDI